MAEQLPRVGWASLATKTSFELRSIYDLIDVIRQRPGLFIGERTLTGLFHFLYGFLSGLDSVGRGFEEHDPPFHGFHDWIAGRFGWRESTMGWRHILLASIPDEAAAFERFFIEVDEFRRTRA